MKRKTIFLCILTALTALWACSNKEEDGSIKKVSVVPAEVTLAEGDSETLTVAVEPSSAEYTVVTWESSDKNVATISRKGSLKAVAAGSATITATIDGVSGTCKVTVTANTTPVSGVSLSETTLKLGVGESQSISATVTPEGAANKKVNWSSSNDKIASVADGNITGVAIGECDIIVKTDDGGFEAKCHVNVVDTPIESISFSNGSESTIIVDQGSSKSLIVSFNPPTVSNKDLDWKSSDNSIATVEPAGDGQANIKFTSAKYGAVEITATTKAEGKTATQSFFVKGAQDLFTAPSGNIYAGKKATYNFNSAYYTDAKNISWTAGGKTVSGATAELAVEKEGENEVTVSADFGGVTITNSFTVNAKLWWMEATIDAPANPRNTYPVFNKECTRAYFITRGARKLFEINLEEGRMGWNFDLNEGKNDNGGDICVNPKNGDIIVSNERHVFCVTSSGSQKWVYNIPEEVTGNSASSLLGCGPAISNDGSVIFAPVYNTFCAIDANTGALLDSFELGMVHVQFGVYGNNDIVLHTNASGGTGGIRFFNFAGGKFGEQTALDSPCADLADITSLAIDKAQEKAYVMGGKGTIIVLDLKKKELGPVATITTAYHWSPCITEDGLMYHATQIGSQVQAIQLNKDLTEASNWKSVFSLGTANNILNFTGVSCDREGNGYFFINGDTDGKATFYKIAQSGGEFSLVNYGSLDKIPEYQGVFNFCDGYLVAGGGNAGGTNKILVRCVDAQRGRGWSGPGGDVCATKNANIAYGN